ncbi:hypothetical protein SLS54_000204 [Diplodia seriata]
MASPNLPSLPTELIQEIARHLAAASDNNSGGQLLSLRQTCRQLHAKTHHPFLDQHFAHRRHLFTEHSLKALVAFSSSNDLLGPAVRRLDLSLLPFEHTRDRNALLNGSDPASPFHVPDPFRRAALAVFLNAQARCRRADVDVALLAEALARLPNLRVLRLRNEPAGCWGYRKLGRDLGWPAYMAGAGAGAGWGGRQVGGGPLLPGTYAFETALVAIAAAAAAGDGEGEGDDGGAAAAVAIQELEVEGGLPPSALVLGEWSLVERLRAPMAHVRVLTLFMSLPLRTTVIIGGGGDQGAGAGAATDAAAALDSNNSATTTHFLSLLPNLEVLRLGAARGRTSNLDRFLADTFLHDDDVGPVVSGKLKALHLLRLDCRRGDVLGPILRRCHALEYLVLEDGAARESCWRPAMQYAAEKRHPSLTGVLCKRFEVLPDDDDEGDVVVGEATMMTASPSGGGEEGGRSPFLEYGGGDDASAGPARHLVVDAREHGERPKPGRRLPWWVFATPEFWEKERVLFQIR